MTELTGLLEFCDQVWRRRRLGWMTTTATRLAKDAVLAAGASLTCWTRSWLGQPPAKQPDVTLRTAAEA
ncbi:MAG TPA: hypothetical protein VHV74_18360 [Pseudonocardiaceae bacterium]|nr:hypothetical protein [Pseudonocardiaceae bacterium]